MLNVTQDFQRLRRRLSTFVAGLAVLIGLHAFARVALAQTPGSGDTAHFTYDTGTPLDVKQVSVKVQDGVTVQDITYTGANGDTVPAFLRSL